MLRSIRNGWGIVKFRAVWVWAALVGAAAGPLFAAFEREPQSIVSLGMGGAGVAFYGGPLDLLRNPSLAGERGLSGGWSQPFSLRELTHKFLAGSAQTRGWTIGAGFDRSGDELYSESRLQAGASREVGSLLRLGVGATWQQLQVENLPRGEGVAASLALTARPWERGQVGLVWRNITRAGLRGYQDKLPESLTAGLSAQVDSRARLAVDLVQEPDFPLEVRGGIEGMVLPELYLRGGMLTEPVQYAAGLSFRHRSFHVHYSLQWHTELGASHFAGLDLVWR